MSKRSFLMHFLLFTLLKTAVCQCPTTFATSSSTTNTLIERTPGVYTPSALVTVPGGWVNLPGATWVWESNSYTTGPYTFLNTFYLADWALSALSSLQLSIAADDYYEVTFNGVIVAPQWSGSYAYVSYYELKQWALGSSESVGSRENRLEMKVKSVGGPAGLIYNLNFVY